MQLEKGDLALEESLKLFEEGVRPLRRLQAGTGRRRGQGADAGETTGRLIEDRTVSRGEVVQSRRSAIRHPDAILPT